MQNQNFNQQYENAREKAKKRYQRFQPVYCPALNDEVVFNDEGFRHLIWQGRKYRPKNVQLQRFALLKHVPIIIGNYGGHLEYRVRKEEVTMKMHGVIETKTSSAQFWGLASRVRGKKIKIIIRQIGNGKKHFLSVF
jgi:hypothetical protein